MSYIYRLNETVVTDEEGIKHSVYGLDAFDENGNILKSVSDIFCDRSNAERLIALCNEHFLELCHLTDVIEDAIAEQYTVIL